MSRALSQGRQRQLLSELRRELPYVFLAYNASETEHRDVIALAEAVLSPAGFQEWLSSKTKRRSSWQAATTALAKATAASSNEPFAAWADRFLFDARSPDTLLDDAARRGLRARLLARLRDRDRRRHVTRILLSRRMASTLDDLRHSGETARDAVERLIREAARRARVPV